MELEALDREGTNHTFRLEHHLDHREVGVLMGLVHAYRDGEPAPVAEATGPDDELQGSTIPVTVGPQVTGGFPSLCVCRFHGILKAGVRDRT